MFTSRMITTTLCVVLGKIIILLQLYQGKSRMILQSSAIDDLSARVLKDSFEYIPRQLTHMFNCSLSGFFSGQMEKVHCRTIAERG